MHLTVGAVIESETEGQVAADWAAAIASFKSNTVVVSTSRIVTCVALPEDELAVMWAIEWEVLNRSCQGGLTFT